MDAADLAAVASNFGRSPAPWTGDVLQQAAAIPPSGDATAPKPPTVPWAIRLASEITNTPRKARLGRVGVDVLAMCR